MAVGAIHAESGMASQMGGHTPGTAPAGALGAMTNPQVATTTAKIDRTSEVPLGYPCGTI